jgi:alkyl sulfatase BDS1-like metallo-beta-lactamase superfamily hydrolase
VTAMGGARKALKVAQSAHAAGDYRWAAQVASHIVFANDKDTRARQILAQSFEQMGFQAESMLWRNMYLTAAQEARANPTGGSGTTVAIDMIAATQSNDLFDLLAIRVDPAKADGKQIAVAFVFPERQERFEVRLHNAVLTTEAGEHSARLGPVAAILTLPRAAFLGMLFAGTSPSQLVQSGTLKVQGDQGALLTLLGSLDPPGPAQPFPIVTP